MLEDQKSIRDWLGKSQGGKKSQLTIEKIPGDASSRQYYRVRKGNSRMIAMKMSPFTEQGESLPFLQVQRHLDKLSVAVPKIFDVEPSQGLILLDDLGDETLLKRLQSVSRKRDQLIWFKRSIDLLTKMQIKATEKKAPIDAYGLYFDVEKLMWEVRFTLNHFYTGRLAPKMSDKDIKTVEEYFTAICKRLASEGWVFTHRDYHCRNIMVHDDELFMIDFQDARLGCAQYDLASLLRDSYYQLEEDLIYELVDYYVSQMQKSDGIPNYKNKNNFVEIFDLMSIQRNFKAIGSFASFFVKRDDARYVKFIGNTFENVRRNLLKFPELDGLKQLLFRYYYF